LQRPREQVAPCDPHAFIDLAASGEVEQRDFVGRARVTHGAAHGRIRRKDQRAIHRRREIFAARERELNFLFVTRGPAEQHVFLDARGGHGMHADGRARIRGEHECGGFRQRAVTGEFQSHGRIGIGGEQRKVRQPQRRIRRKRAAHVALGIVGEREQFARWDLRVERGLRADRRVGVRGELREQMRGRARIGREQRQHLGGRRGLRERFEQMTRRQRIRGDELPRFRRIGAFAEFLQQTRRHRRFAQGQRSASHAFALDPFEQGVDRECFGRGGARSGGRAGAHD
jgi:hypothetical protein